MAVDKRSDLNDTDESTSSKSDKSSVHMPTLSNPL